MPLYIGNEKIVEIATHKVLGVTIDNNSSWTNHVNELTNCVSQNLYQLTKINFMHKIVSGPYSGYAPSDLKLNFHSNQNKLSHKL